ncbi:MAG: pyrroline-5-carboxylate reductase [Verrucomicrobiota bacterium]|jgi:pyrroline-5-carboxylate reductase
MTGASEIFFVGAGRMATALAIGAVKAGIHPPERMMASALTESTQEKFTRTTGIRCVGGNQAAAGAKMLLLCVKPQKAREVCLELAPLLSPETHVVSVCAGLSIDTLAGWLGTRRITRTMPNTPLSVGLGATGLAHSEALDAAARAAAQRLFEAAGVAVEVPEEKLDAVTSLSGSGPAYVFELCAALEEAAASQGLPPELAHKLAVQTLLGAAEMLSRGLGSPDALRDAVTSPGGTTAAALGVLKEHQFRQIWQEALGAAVRRAQELGRK